VQPGGKGLQLFEKGFETERAVILGVSKDSPESHKRFIEKKELKIKLLSDEQADVHKAYDVLHPKSLRGTEVTGTVRTTFLIDPEGKIIRVWDNVKAAEHAEKVLSELKALKKE